MNIELNEVSSEIVLLINFLASYSIKRMLPKLLKLSSFLNTREIIIQNYNIIYRV